jgi:hypothetical protein
MSKFKFVIQGGKKLIKLYRGETIAKNLEPPKSNFYYPKKSQKYRGRWFSPDKNEAKYFLQLGIKVKEVKEF